MWDMIIKERSEPKELMILRILNARMELSSKDLNHFLNLEKGFIGEKKFDKLIENLSNDWLILNDLLLEFNTTFFQIDSVLIAQDTIYLIDVKNYEGDYYIDGDWWYTISGNEIKNPLDQLMRSESLFRRYLRNLGFNTTIEARLVFVNPEFHLYQSTPNQPIIFPTQLNRFLNKINKMSAKLTNRHMKLAEHLISKHINNSPFSLKPNYNYGQLKKGITCRSFHSFMELVQEDKLVCRKCGSTEDLDSAVLRSVGEYTLLFPDRKITSKDIYEWCGGVKSTKALRRILSIKYKLKGHGKYSYFE
jgi:hypothetical protein